ncbi:MAG TPA: hypothetical protein VH083_22295 [Myxococcales bacterium]|nr:hypothetical protein [Myxococcales bacterium]
MEPEQAPTPEQAPPVEPHETLFILPRKRFVPIYGKSDEGVPELVLHVGLKEFCFDEPDLFPWAEKLIEQDSFVAGAATSWTPEPLEWPRIKELLDTFVVEGIMSRTPPVTAASPPPTEKHLRFLAEDAKRRTFSEPQSFNPDSEKVIQEITGLRLPNAFLECAMPVYMLAHTTFDRENRHVGEINAFPDMMRLKLETEWRTCNYAGSRYRAEMPMNMTALKSMLSHWTPVLRSMLAIREEFVKRFPQNADGRWKLGEVLFGSYSVLTTVAYQVMRRDNPVGNGQLDPVMSSLFRVTDGIRMVSGFLLDIMEYPAYHADLVTWRDIVEAAERWDQYRSSRGVCAGPTNMIEELVQTMMNGKPVASAGPNPQPLGEWTKIIPEGVDYGMLGLQMNACLMMLWVKLGLAVSSIRDALERVPDLNEGKVGVLRAAIEEDYKRLKQGRNVLAGQRDLSEIYYGAIYDNVQQGIRGLAAEDRKLFKVEMNPPEGLLGAGARGAVRDLFGSLEKSPEASALLQEIGDYVFDYVRYERNALKPIAAIQRQINTLLGRPQAEEPLGARHLAVGPALRRATFNYGPNSLTETIEKALGIGIDSFEDTTTVTYGGRSFDLR